ncbi:glycosyltransferase [Carbonactinospora thermoautotrophica]|uniref:glycosyltransferase n=1 Tax=Carbonactinospora thermoautotrophica TaxID=1469144 RepID=UPI00226DF33E|nr:glycosyltransferase [Carbonactinospora thermoautotrophica]
MRLTVLVNAGPWLPVPPRDYGGIENVLGTLIARLRRRGVRVVLCGVGSSTIEVDRLVASFPDGQFRWLAAPYNQVMGIAYAHMQTVVAELCRAADIDVVHDHLEVVGPGTLSLLGARFPPVLQTLHWDVRKHPDFYGRFNGAGRTFFACVSERQRELAPENLRRQVLGVVPLGVEPAGFPFRRCKPGPYLMLARVCPLKGQHVAARVCRGLRLPLLLAGPVAGFADAASLAAADDGTGEGAGGNADVRYFRTRVAPLLGGDVRWVGSVGGRRRLELLSRARAALFPAQWEEPGGTAVLEALACGTPVVGFRRGCLPELVQHGVTGFLADSEEEFAGYLPRADEIDPAACRRVVEERFSAELMAEGYLRLYAEVQRRA